MVARKPPTDERNEGHSGAHERGEDSYAKKATVLPLGMKKAAEMAPEVSQGAWRERAFVPRAVLSGEEIRGALQVSLRDTLSSARHLGDAIVTLQAEWLPFLRQALEQAGGDGIDAWLLSLFSGSFKQPKHSFFGELADAMTQLNASSDLSSFQEKALALIEQLGGALQNQPVKLSFKQMERQLEGKIEVGELLGIRWASDEDLRRRAAELSAVIGQLRDEIRTKPGKQPEGMYANFVRLKTEFKVLEAELTRRSLP